MKTHALAGASLKLATQAKLVSSSKEETPLDETDPPKHTVASMSVSFNQGAQKLEPGTYTVVLMVRDAAVSGLTNNTVTLK